MDSLKPDRKSKPQDITKMYMLCDDCEGRFNKYETAFRKRVMPANRLNLAPIAYGDWMLKFAVSLSWRILTYLKYAPAHSANHVTHKGMEQFVTQLVSTSRENAEEALEIWRAFLMDERSDIDKYKQHLIIMNGNNFPHENCNAVGFTLFQEGGIIATQAIMTQFIVLGMVEDPPEWNWEGTEISPINGNVGIQQSIPRCYLDWLANMYSETDDSSRVEWENRKK